MTKYCQIVSQTHRVKRFIFACMAKLNKEEFDDVIDVDECTVELRKYTPKNWHKVSNVNLLRAAGGKPKHPNTVNLFSGISHLVIFTGIMRSEDYQMFLQKSIIPFINEKYPYRHRFFMDNDPKHTSHSTREF